MKNKSNIDIQPQINRLIELCGGNTEEINSIVNEIVDKIHKEKVEPMEFCVPLNKVKSRLDEGEYEIVEYENGYEYNVKGGFKLFVNPKCLSLYGALKFMLSILKGETKAETKEEEDAFLGYVYAMTQIIQSPILAAGDTNLMVKITHMITSYLLKLQDKIFNSELKEDDNPELTQAMNDATIEVENIATELKKVDKEFQK